MQKKVRKNATCYWCYAYDKNPVSNYPLCLLGEEQHVEPAREKFSGFSIYVAKPTRIGCKPKTIKEYCIRAEKNIKLMEGTCHLK